MRNSISGSLFYLQTSPDCNWQVVMVGHVYGDVQMNDIELICCRMLTTGGGCLSVNKDLYWQLYQLACYSREFECHELYQYDSKEPYSARYPLCWSGFLLMHNNACPPIAQPIDNYIRGLISPKLNAIKSVTHAPKADLSVSVVPEKFQQLSQALIEEWGQILQSDIPGSCC